MSRSQRTTQSGSLVKSLDLVDEIVLCFYMKLVKKLYFLQVKILRNKKDLIGYAEIICQIPVHGDILHFSGRKRGHGHELQTGWSGRETALLAMR